MRPPRVRAAGLGLLFGLAALPAAAGHVNVATISGSINPASSDYLQRAIATSEDDGAVALIVELDTPGGLLASTKDVIQAILNARVPVVVYVSPEGGWAASAGAFITLAGHVAAMAPGTSIGAAHPVGIGGGGGGGGEGEERDVAEEKAENFAAAFIETIAKRRHRNVEWAMKAVRDSVAIAQDEALALGVIDLVADDRTDLLEKIQGREVELPDGKVEIDVTGAEVRMLDRSALNRFLDVLASPDIAVLLMLAGMLGLYMEFSQPGLILPGVFGVVCLILGLIALQILPFSWLGLLLLLSGIALFVAEVLVGAYGILFALGAVCLLLGGSMIFEVPEISDLRVSFWEVLVPAVGAMTVFAGIVVFAVSRTFRRPQTAGTGELIGMVGRATTELAPEGTVFVRGEYWKASAETPVPAGGRVEVVGVESLELRVRSAAPR